ncbi:MAG: NAD-dependent epimerase/dehydratase family protein [Alkalispirochaetaceae bacterium]
METIEADRHNVELLDRRLGIRRFDAVIDMICFGPEEAAETVQLFQHRCDHLLVVSSVAAYKRPYRTVPTQEDTEELCDDPAYSYGYKKARMEEYLFGQRQSDLPITVVRPSLTFGPGARNVGILRQNRNILSRISAGKPLVMFGDGTGLWAFSFADDVARGIVSLIGVPGAYGEAFNIASEEPSLWMDLYRELGNLIGQEPMLAFVPSATLYRALPETTGHIYFEKRYPGLFDGSKLRQVAPGFTFETGLAAGLEEVVESWERDGLEVDPELDRLEDRLVEQIGEMKISI